MPCAVPVGQENLSSADHVSDVRDRKARNARRNALSAGRGEEQFVVFSAMESEFEINFAGWPSYRGSGDGFGYYLRSDSTFFANVGEIGGEAVAGIDHGRGKTFFEQNAAKFDARIRKQMADGMRLAHLADFRDCGGRAAQFSADVDAVSGPRARAQHSFSWGRGADDNNIRNHARGRLRSVAAGEGYAVFARQGKQALCKAANPAIGQVGRQSQRKKGSHRRPSHGCDVAQAARQTAVSNRFRGVRLPSEMNSLKGEVGCNQNVERGR